MIEQFLTRLHELFRTGGQRHNITLNMVKGEHPLCVNIYVGDHWQTMLITEDELQKGAALAEEIKALFDNLPGNYTSSDFGPTKTERGAPRVPVETVD